MLGEEGKINKPSGSGTLARRTYSRSVSWTDRSPSSRHKAPPQPPNTKPRPFLPPLQPLSIRKPSVEEWPSAGSDDLGVWPVPQTPRGSIRQLDSSQPTKDFQFKRDKLAFYDKECSRIAEHIYLGSDTVAKNHELLRQNGITHVLNCVGFVCAEYFKSDFVYKTLWLQDSPSEDITSILYDVFDYFEDVREQGGRVLVHCCQGVSRSSSLVIAYLMWREGQSFEDAFQYVKNARGVTNPNMGFACQLLQCQKRVHALPASPNSIQRMYRMAPHSPYDPLHLVPKTVNQPGAKALDSRGSFVVHVPSTIYVWIGKNCSPVMSSNARGAALQVVRYERAKGPILTIHEGEETPQFWIALSSGDSEKEGVEIGKAADIGARKVGAYDLDFEIFYKAVADCAGSETCVPAKEHGWGILRQKLATGVMKELLSSPKCVNMEDGEEEKRNSEIEPLSPSTNHSFECYLNNNNNSDAIVVEDTPKAADSGVASNPFPWNKSPTLSPSSSDYASSFTFSPSSGNWSDLSFVSSRQPSPSGMESTEDAPFAESSSLLHKEVSSMPETLLANDGLGGASSWFQMEGSSLSIAERRGSNPPPRVLLSSINESSQLHKNLVRSQSFCLPDLDNKLIM
ncbi:protein-tyrosine-phosphatase MKP1 isoform X1 [Arachis duranensis]|uniref:Protein-tyrosine-phosphatase MKP1 isoform X1 n=1 Tax=Arachis duranensis TaxID=130453 RepID=A0A9C6TBQ8_ARADU|nr:protein-tyrosine-phosphatase MKP1 isoform X1 [Arachis duranensis]